MTPFIWLLFPIVALTNAQERALAHLRFLNGNPKMGIVGPPGQDRDWLAQNRLLGNGLGGLNKKDDDRSWHFPIHPIHIAHVPSIRPTEPIAPELRATRMFSEIHPPVRPSAGVSGFGKWVGGLFAGLGAGIAALFRGILGLRCKQKSTTQPEPSGELTLVTGGKGGVWLRSDS